MRKTLVILLVVLISCNDNTTPYKSRKQIYTDSVNKISLKRFDSATKAKTIAIKIENKRILEEKIKLSKKLLSKLYKNYDDVQDVTFYRSKNSPKNILKNSFHLYIVTAKGYIPTLRLKIVYTAQDWLFIQNYTIKTDSKVYEVNPDEVKRDNDSSIYEWCDFEVGPYIRNVLNQIVNSKSSKIRYNGRDYYNDRLISKKEIEALKEVLSAFETIEGRIL